MSRSGKAFTVLAPLLLSLAVGVLHAQVSGSALSAVLMIRAPGGNGTGFVLQDAGRQYVITAKHIVTGLGDQSEVQIRRGDEWLTLQVQVFRCEDPIDIAVLVAPQLLASGPLSPTSRSTALGEQVYFAGYPYSLFNEAQELTPFPLAFVKSGVFSGVENTGGAVRFYVDGQNNPGFSGGPMLVRSEKTRGNASEVIAVVSGFRFDTTPVQVAEPVTPDEVTPEDRAKRRIVVDLNGQLRRLKDDQTAFIVKQNTGFVLGYGIKHAMDLIRDNPIGPEIEAN